MTLDMLRRGDKFRIEKVTLKGEIGKRIVDMGFNKGVEGEVLRCALWGDPIEVHIRDYNISLRKSEASGVEVVITEIPRRGRGRGRGMGFGRGKKWFNKGGRNGE